MVTLQFNMSNILVVIALSCFMFINCTPLPVTNFTTSNGSDLLPGDKDTNIPSEGNCSSKRAKVENGPLLLTPYIENGCLEEARKLSRVRVPGMTLESFSGFLTVDKGNDANLFFWFFPSKNNPRTAPIILWLNGGPGTSSLSGLFAENGPYYITEGQTLKYREDNWATEFNMIYLDNPVGTGFSFSKSKEAYKNSSQAVAQDIYKAMIMFFKIFDHYTTNQFFVAGQSYGGKFAVLLADVIDLKNSVEHSNKIPNFKGIICIAGFINPPNQMKLADYWYQVGLLTPSNYSKALGIEKEIQHNWKKGNIRKATELSISYIVANGAFLQQAANFTTGESILYSALPYTFSTFPTFVNRSDVRRAIHVANLTFVPASSDVASALFNDLFTEVVSVLEQILNKGYKVLLMSGNLDNYIPPTTYWKITWDLQWKHTVDFQNSHRNVWKVDENDKGFAGYLNCAMNMCYSLLLNGSHRLTSDQPRSTAVLVRRFITDQITSNN